jgi:hypothetical protein
MDLSFENSQVFMAVMALVSVSLACLFTLYLRDERRGRRADSPAAGHGLVRLSDYRREMKQRDRPAA